MSATVEIAAEAEAQIKVIDAWWRRNRRRVPGRFADDLERALDLIAELPDLGRAYEGSRLAGVRRYFLPVTGHHIYYVHDQASALVTVYAVWNARAGEGPDL